MWSDETKPEDLETASGTTNSMVRTKTGAGRNSALVTTPECATEQREHSWLGSLEFSG
jgi:hypothetical protein